MRIGSYKFGKPWELEQYEDQDKDGKRMLGKV